MHATTISRHRQKLGLVQIDPEKVRAQEEKEEQRRAEALQKLAERKVRVSTRLVPSVLSYPNVYSKPIADVRRSGQGEPLRLPCACSGVQPAHARLR